MKKQMKRTIYIAFLILVIWGAGGCKKQAPVPPTVQPASPAAVKENPADTQPAENPRPSHPPKSDNSTPQSQHAGVHWFTDYEQARAKAVKENKDLLINFSGSDWCGFCIRLEKDVFSQPAFAQEAEKYFVFMLVDFPNDTSGQSPELRKQNELLARIYRFRGYFPTIYLTGPDGRPYAEAEYKEGGPQVYLDYLLRIRQYRNQ
jgi:thioredoxin-related protein